MADQKDKKAPVHQEYAVCDVFPEREFTKAEQLRIAAEISRLLMYSDSEKSQ